MPAQLTEGEAYTVKATTKNLSTKAGVPVAASLTIHIAAVVDSQVILEDCVTYGFAAEETHAFDFTLAIPTGTGGKAGAVTAIVYDPNGNEIADGSLDIGVVPVAIAEFIYVSGVRWTRVGYEHRFEIDVQNIGNAAGICSLAMHWRERYESLGEDWWAWQTVGLPSATLQPGEIKTFGYGMIISYVVDHLQVYFSGSPGTSGVKYLRHTPRVKDGWWQV